MTRAVTDDLPSSPDGRTLPAIGNDDNIRTRNLEDLFEKREPARRKP